MKLVTYTGERTVVTAADIEEICTTQTQNKIFDMVRAVTDRNQEKALELYYDLLTLREPAYENPFSSCKTVSAASSCKGIFPGGSGSAGDGVQAWDSLFRSKKHCNLCKVLSDQRAASGSDRFCRCRGSGENRSASGSA